MKMNRLIPMLPVKSMPASVDFYCKMLGFEVEKRNDDWGWAMLRFDECRLMVDQSINARPGTPRDSILYLYPDDIAEYHNQVRANGLAVPELEVTFYGLTEFRINDPDGNRLWIGQDTSLDGSKHAHRNELHVSNIERLLPILVCEDIPAAHDFLVDAFGFSSGGIHRTPEGQAVHAEVRAGDFVIWLHRVAADLKLASPHSMPAATSGLVVYVDDVDAHYARARARGARPESEPKDMPYGQREYGVSDREGHRWWFATRLP